MTEAEIQHITGKIEVLEARFEERWTAHDKAADERLARIDSSMLLLSTKLDEFMASRTCVKHDTLIGTMQEKINSIVGVLVALGLTVVGVVIDLVVRR